MGHISRLQRTSSKIHILEQLIFSSLVSTAEFSKFAGISSSALSQHYLLGFEIAQLEFHISTSFECIGSITTNLNSQVKFVCFFVCFTCGKFSPMRVNCEGGVAAWLPGTLMVSSTQHAGTQTDLISHSRMSGSR